MSTNLYFKLETILISKKSFFFLRISILFWKILFQIGIFYFLLENIILLLETAMLLQRPLFQFGIIYFLLENSILFMKTLISILEIYNSIFFSKNYI
jgi:hypothetical protein